MHYFSFNIADYRKDTQHLTPIEHYIYRELMDWYYLDEHPITLEIPKITRRLRLGSENAETIELVLNEFFEKSENGYVHHRIEHEIQSYHSKAKTARINGSKGGRPPKPKKTQPVNSGLAKKTQSKANHKPITNNHIKRFTPPSIPEVQEYLTEKSITTFTADQFVNHYASTNWMRGKNKIRSWKACVNTWVSKEPKKQEQDPYAGAI